MANFDKITKHFVKVFIHEISFAKQNSINHNLVLTSSKFYGRETVTFKLK